MGFKDRYISETENQTNPDPKKVVLSNDAYAVGEMLENIFIELRNSK
jgi:hypothetical protein